MISADVKNRKLWRDNDSWPHLVSITLDSKVWY